MKAKNSLEINDLIDDAVNNALARRNEALVDISDAEGKNITGGITTGRISIKFQPPIVIGKIITTGIFPPTKTLIA
ncbi:hypothetical protein [Trichormus sp. NMC-1]|uniref:hypothetical protein n=1 Tax=Trichormus sp. NMC-1 TaxID=1853259 RepID=UPI0008DC0B54|nr:hypothetical protein [Trichormus sp. NMC-1]